MKWGTTKIGGYLVDAFTASGAVLGLFALWAIHTGQFGLVWWLVLGAIAIDSVDGVLARFFKKEKTKIDGALLDNMVDFLNYVIVIAFYLLVAPGIVSESLAIFSVIAIILSSAYQFSQVDAKTEDHFFLGFPSYWNLVVFYLAVFALPENVNFLIILACALLVFVPIKYVYPSRIEHVSRSKLVLWAVRINTVIFGVSFVGAVANFPHVNPIWLVLAGMSGLFYVGLSLYRTFVPLRRPSF